MKLITSLLIFLLGIGMYGQTVDSGSTGADGPFNPPTQVPPGLQVDMQGDCTAAPGCTVTVPLREPPNHVFHFTTVMIGQFVTVKFRRNRVNTPVFLLARGDVTINGTIDVSGQNAAPGILAALGGPGGFNGGLGSVPGSPTDQAGGAGSGPGGGGAHPSARHGCSGSFGSVGGNCPPEAQGTPYGNPELQPLIGGSGGGGAHTDEGRSPGGNGGGGGGALLIASVGTINLGSVGDQPAIRANGGDSEGRLWGGGGSGGAIRLVATTLRGNRKLDAVGGGPPPAPIQYYGGVGRIRLESFSFPYTGSTRPQYTFGPPPTPLILQTIPTVRLVSVAGVPVPGQPTADINTADLTLPRDFTGPARIVVEATNVPSGIQARIIVAPQLGAGPRTITPVTLTGPSGQPKQGMVTVTLPTRGVGIISVVIDSVVPEP